MTTLTLTGPDRAVFDALNGHYDGRLELLHFYDTGSTARVFHVRMPVTDDLNLSVDRIVKVLRHDQPTLSFPDIERAFLQEVRCLISLSHTNLISIYSTGSLEIDGVQARFFVMEYLSGARDLDEYLTTHAGQLRAGNVIDILFEAAQGLSALHRANVLHCDIKFGNILVGDGQRVKIADLGFSKEISGAPGATGVHTTLWPLPETFKDCITELTDPRRTVVTIDRTRLNPSFDLHYFGKVLEAVANLPALAGVLDSLDRQSLLLAGERTDLDRSPRLPRYASISQLAADLRKLAPGYMTRIGIRELSAYTGTRTIRIPVTGSIPFSDRVQQLISHPLFLRLHSAFQLGFSYYVFPGATHTRFEHSLGVFANVARYLTALLSDDHQPYFRQIVDEEKIQTALLAGLVHDVGQHSFAHSLEDLGLAQRHEDVAKAFITGEGVDGLVPGSFTQQGPLGDVIRRYWGEANLERLLWIITNIRPPGLRSDVGWDVMQSIVNGPLDADKTDYLLRDAHHAGVEYARSIDITRFMNSLTAGIVRDDELKERGTIAITWKGAQSAENIILARSQMFWVLYWHHAVRSAHAAVGEACYEHLLNADDAAKRAFNRTLYCGTVGELLALLEASEQSRARELAGLLRLRRLYKRGIDLEFREDEQLYNHLTRLRDKHAPADPLLKKVAAVVAEEANKVLAQKGARVRLTDAQLMIDIPKASKDRLGEVFIVGKNSERPRSYESRVMQGSTAEWQNRVRTIRIFVHPEVDTGARKVLRENGLAILGKL